MAMLNNRSIPRSAIIPELRYDDVRQAVGWLCRCFGFIERLRIGGPLPAFLWTGFHHLHRAGTWCDQ